MAWTDLKNAIGADITSNGSQEITGDILNQTLDTIVSIVGENATFKGVATESTAPGTPDGPVFYIIPGNGSYSNFGGLVVSDHVLRVAVWNGATWSHSAVGCYDTDQVDQVEIHAGKKLEEPLHPIPAYGSYLTRGQVLGFFLDVTLTGFDTNGRYYGGCYIDADNKRVQIYEVDSSGVILSSSDPDRFYVNVTESKNNVSKLVGSGGHGSAVMVVDWSKIPSSGASLINLRFGDAAYSDHEGYINDWARLKALQDFQSSQESLNPTFALKSELPDIGNLVSVQDIVYYSETYSTNLYDFDTAVQTPGYINSSGGVSTSPEGTYHPSPYIPWRDGTEILVCKQGVAVTSGSFSAMQYDASFEPILGSWTGTSANILSVAKYAGAQYLRITMREGSQDQLNYGATALPYESFYTDIVYDKDYAGNDVVFKPNTEDSALLALLADFVNASKMEKLRDFIAGLWQNKNILHVKHPTEATDGVTYFDSIVLAVESITDASPINPYEVQIWADIIATQDTDFEDLEGIYYKTICHVKKDVTLRGIGKRKVIHAELPDSFPTSVEYYETMHFDGGGSIENLEITGRNVRYAIHYERSFGVIGLNQNTVSTIRNCHVEHKGVSPNLPVQWTAPDAFGCGTGQGLTIEFVNSTVIGKRHGIRVHDNRPFQYPIRIRLVRCRIYGDPSAIQFDNYSSGISNEYEVIDCDIQGRLLFTQTSSIYTDKQCIPLQKISGAGCNPFHYVFGANTPVGLRITSDTTGTGSSVAIVSDSETDIIGEIFTRNGNVGVSAWVNGHECLTATGYLLSDRLGDCSVTAKTLYLNIDGVNRNVVFNQDFSSSDNAAVLAFINSSLSGYATCTLDHPIKYYHPEFSEVLFSKKWSAATFTEKGVFVKFTGLNEARDLQAGESPDGFLLDDASAGDFVRILNNTIVTSSGNFAPLFDQTAVFSEGDRFSIQNGKLIIDANSELDIFAISSSLIRIRL